MWDKKYFISEKERKLNCQSYCITTMGGQNVHTAEATETPHCQSSLRAEDSKA